MRSFRQLAFLALPLFSTVLAASQTEQADQPKTIYASAQEAFQDLLNALPEESLQAALSGLKDFQDGVFESHHRGVEHVHDMNPALATKLIVAAVHDLKKRQTPSNGTTTEDPAPAPQTSDNASPTAPTSDEPASTPAESSEAPQQTNDGTTADSPTATVTTTAERPALIPVESTVTESGRTVVQTAQVLSEVTASVPVTVVRTNQQGSTVTATENRPAVIKTTTDSAGRTTVTTSAAEYAPTAGQVQTATDEQGSTFLTTYTPGGGLVSSIKLITTTDAEGRPSTMTSYTFVDPIQATQTADDTADAPTGKPSVQTGAAMKNGAQYAAVGLGALAFLV
jgi:hypothetical protein